jgi:uncharacterized protein
MDCAVTNIDLDVTKACNLQCVYCFKGDLAGRARDTMPLEHAMAAVDWLLDVSRGVDYVNVNLMGGEPLMAFEGTIDRLVPYAKRRGLSLGKTVQFGITSNLTLVTREIVDFSIRWGMGWHLSIDGVPDVELSQRLGNSKGLLERVEDAVRMILAYKPGFCARGTFIPENFSRMYDSLLYLRDLGFVNFGFAKSTQKFSPEQADVHLHELDRISDELIRRAENGEYLQYGAFCWFLKLLENEGRPTATGCGAGRGYVMVDQAGNLWPCHRFDGASSEVGQSESWCLGNIFSGEFDRGLHRSLLGRDAHRDKERCEACSLRFGCGGGCPAENLSEAGRFDLPRREVCDLLEREYEMLREKHQRIRRSGNPKLLEFIDYVVARG